MTNTKNLQSLIEQFKTVSTSVETTVDIIERTPELLNEVLQEITKDSGAIVLSEIEHIDKKIFKVFKTKSQNLLLNPTDDQLATAQYGITDAFAAISSTGSVCVTITNSMAGSFSLFTKTHIVVVDSKSILERPREIFQVEPYRTITSNSDFLFISGSSATADMGPLVRGVHGPAKLHVIILL